MKKFLFFTVIALGLFLGFSNNGFAISGACSSHGGVNCEAGTDIDGSVICKDGWRNSSVSYSSMIMCMQPSLNDKVKLENSIMSGKDMTYVNEDYGFLFKYKNYFNDVTDHFDTISFLDVPAELAKFYEGRFDDYEFIGAFCMDKNCENANMDAMEIYREPVIEGGILAQMKIGKPMWSEGKIMKKRINRIPVIVKYDHPEILLNDPGYYLIQYSFFINSEDVIVVEFRTVDKTIYKQVKKDFEKMMKTFRKI